MTESCFVYKRMVCCWSHVLVMSCYVTPPPCYPRLVIIDPFSVGKHGDIFMWAELRLRQNHFTNAS